MEPMDIRQLVNLANGSTALGVAIARAGRARIRRGPHGVLVAEECSLMLPTAGAFTVGNVVITGGPMTALVGALPNVLRHEARHSTQWSWLGPLFLPLYGTAVAWSWLRTGDRAAGNAFERGAGLADGGYPDVPPRPLLPAVRGLLHR